VSDRIDPSILNLQPSDPAKVARRVRSAAPPVRPSSEIPDFVAWPPSVALKYQGSIGACNGHAAATGLEFARIMQGMTHVPLSAWWVYGMLVRGRDVGSNIMDALALCEDVGVATEASVRYGDYSGRYPTTARDDAARYRVDVGFALGQDWGAILTAVAMLRPINLSVCANQGWLVNNGSLDAYGCPPVGRGPANHAVLVGGGIKTLPNGERAILMTNSWDEGWGIRGRCWLTRAHIESATWCEAYTIGAAASDPQDIGYAVA
jgi:hypothetical protein